MAQTSTSARYQAYQQANRTLGKTRQVVMLYDGAIRFLLQAQEAALSGDHERRYFKLARVADIINALQSGLDISQGQDMARRLGQFYQSMALKILHLHAVTTMTAYQPVLDELKSMRAMWDQVDRSEAR